MPDILVRGLDVRVVKQLKARAKQNGRSLQGEVKLALEQVAATEPVDVAAIVERWKKIPIRKKNGPSSLDILREVREQ